MTEGVLSLPVVVVGGRGKVSGHRVGKLCKGTSGVLDLERRRRRGAAISVLDADLKFVNRRPMEEIARSPRRTGCVRSRSSECQPSISPRIFNPTNALGVQYKPSHSPSLVPPSNRPSPITPHDDGPSTPPTNGIAMAHRSRSRETRCRQLIHP